MKLCITSVVESIDHIEKCGQVHDSALLSWIIVSVFQNSLMHSTAGGFFYRF